MKKSIKGLGVFGVLSGIVLSRVLSKQYGNNARTIIVSMAILALIVIISILMYKRHIMAAIVFITILIPIIIAFTGMFLDNLYLVLTGILLAFISIALLIKNLPRQ